VSRRARWLAVLVVLGVAGGGLAATHRWALGHVEYFTHDTPTMLDCTQCHVYAYHGTLGDHLLTQPYRTPTHVALSPDERRLYVAAETANRLLVVDTETQRVTQEVSMPGSPQDVALSRDGRRAYVSCNAPGGVAVVDLEQGRVVTTLPAGDSPQGVALSPDERRLFVANWLSDDVSVIDLQTGAEEKRLIAGRAPSEFALTPDGRTLLVANALAHPAPYPQSPMGELTVIDVARAEVTRRIPISDVSVASAVAAVSNDLALMAVVQTRNLVPALQVARGWVMTSGLALVNLATGVVTQVPLDEVNAYYADPAAVQVTPDGQRALVSHGGANVISVVDLSRLRALTAGAAPRARERFARDLGLNSEFVTARIPTSADPFGLALARDGRTGYVAERLDDQVAVLDLTSSQVRSQIGLGGPSRITLRRRGEQLFRSGRGSFQGEFSCRSCHPRNHADNLQYDLEPDGLGRNVLNNRSLLGVAHTGPFKWNGKNTSLYMQDGFRFATFLTRTEPFPSHDLVALAAFLQSLRVDALFPTRPAGPLTGARQRGFAFFTRTQTKDGRPIPAENRCVTCHPAPLYTDRKLHDVGSGGPTDKGGAFDAPHLLGVRYSAPYLHDGRAATLEEVWTRFNPHDTHGVTNDLTKAEFNDLMEFLKGL